MPTQRLEAAGANITIWGSLIALFCEAMKWLSENMALISVLTLLGGFALQYYASRRNTAKIEAEKLWAKLEFESKQRLREAEDKRSQEEHDLKMQVLRGEVPDRRAVKERIDVVGEREGDAIG